MKSIQDLLEFSVINIDKPAGPTSYNVSDYVRERLGIRKTSHMGTLDPGVTGVLPITLNRACKLSSVLLRKNKTYVGVMRLHADVDDDKLHEAIESVTGKIIQLPPVRSKVKRAKREREVFMFKVIEREGKDVLFEAHVEAGTYVRTLVHDMGKKIGGANMIELRRVSAGTFNESNAIKLFEFDSAVDDWKNGDERALRKMIIPAQDVIREVLPILTIKKDRLDLILKGKPIHSQDVMKHSTLVVGEHVGVFCGTTFVEVARVVLNGDTVAVPTFVYN